MYSKTFLLLLLIGTLPHVNGRRNEFDSKCKRKCSAELGSMPCWTETTEGFTYGLATAMVDYCRIVFQIRQLADDKESWYQISRDILTEQIEEFEIEDEGRHLEKENIQKVVEILLDQCYNATSTTSTSEPPCPSCTEKQDKEKKQWIASAISLTSISAFLAVLTLLAYALNSYQIDNTYKAM